MGYIYSGTRTVFAWEIGGAGAAEAMENESASATKAVFDIYIIENKSFKGCLNSSSKSRTG